MTLLLLCYMCGQGEKVRLTMRMLIIFIMSYVLVLGGVAPTFTTVSAFDIGLQPQEDGSYIPSSEHGVTVSTHDSGGHGGTISKSSSSDTKDTISSTVKATTSTSNKTTINKIKTPHSYFQELVDLKSVYPDHIIFKEGNGFIIEYFLGYTDGKSVTEQIEDVSSIADGLKAIPVYKLKAMGIHAEYLFPIVDFILMKVESQMRMIPNSGGNDSTQGDETLGKVTEYDDFVVIENKKWSTYSRMNIYVNKKFELSCEYGQCGRLKIKATSGDRIDLFIKYQGNVDKRETHFLGQSPKKNDSTIVLPEIEGVTTSSSTGKTTGVSAKIGNANQQVNQQATPIPTPTSTTPEKSENSNYDQEIYDEFDTIISDLMGE